MTMAAAAATANALKEERYVAWQMQRSTREKFLRGLASLMAGYTAFKAQAEAELRELDAQIAAYDAQTKRTA